MGLRFIIGRSGTDKSGLVLQEIKEKLLQEPAGKPIFYIVPEQMTFQQEYELFTDPELEGSIRAQVMSFSRLAWRILQETGGITRQFISSVGIQMMLRKIIEEKKDDWLTFQKAADKQGFLQQMEAMITEFKRYQVTPDDLLSYMEHIKQFVHKEEGEEILSRKLFDLYEIYEKLTVMLEGKYVDSEDQLQLLAAKVKESKLLDGAEVYVDGFHSFTPIELEVLLALLKKCKAMTVTLTLDEVNKERQELDLFYQTNKTLEILTQIAEENGIPIAETKTLDPMTGRFHDRPYFLHLEENFDKRPAKAYEGEAPIQIYEAVHPRAEVEGAAQEILRLVREEQYRFKEVAVFIREPDVYHDLIETIFQDYGIPVFIDQKRTMLNHPLIEFIRSGLEMVEGNWKYDAVFRLLKTGFIPSSDREYPLTDDAIDELENYVLEYGIKTRKRWFDGEVWKYQRFRGFDQAVQTDEEIKIQQRINKYREQVVTSLAFFDEQMRKAKTVREYCLAIYTLLEKLHVPKKLEQMRDYYDEHGMIEKGREEDQVWNAVIQLLDEMVEMVGDEEMPLKLFRTTLEAGLETLTFSHVPPSMDHVIVGTIDRSRISGIRSSFLLGVNDGSWPMKPPQDGIINEKERELLENHGLTLADSSKRQLLDDWFYMYLAFTSAKDKLWVSFTLSNEEGKGKTPSQLIHRIEELFPSCKNHILLQDPDELQDAERFITTPKKTRSALTVQLARLNRGYPVKPVWFHVLNWYMDHEDKYGKTYNILQSLFYQNRPKNLSKETVKEIYPKELKASVSRLETYFQCSYQHFAKYSLHLEERRTYKLDAPDIGMLFHEALRIITDWIREERKDFAEIRKQDAAAYAKRAVGNLSPILQHQILHSSNRYQYIQKKLEEIIARATYILSEQARLTDFSPVGLELAFGYPNGLPPLKLELPSGYQLQLRGRIDRVDKAVKEDELYLRIIDYKSSARGLNLVEVYYGLALQMLAYLDVVIRHSETWLKQKATPAGVLYFHVHNPMVTEENKLAEDEIEREIFKSYKMKGLLLADDEIVKMMDTATETGYSDIVPVAFKKGGGFYSNSRVATEDAFHHLQQYIRLLMKRAGEDMVSGKVRLNPYQYKNRTACTFCPFHAVCQFDPMLEDHHYHKLKEMKEEEVFGKISSEVEQDG